MADEGEVLNSKRRLFRVAYTPLQIPARDVDASLLMKGAFLRFLGLTEAEAQELGDSEQAFVVSAISAAEMEGEYVAAIRRLKDIRSSALVALAEGVAERRQAEVDGIVRRIRALDRRHGATVEREARRPAERPAPPAERRVDLPVGRIPTHPGEGLVFPFESAGDPVEPVTIDPEPDVTVAREPIILHPFVVAQVGGAIATRLPQTLEWAAVHRGQDMVALAGALNVPLAGGPYPQQYNQIVVALNLVLPELKRRHLVAKRVAELIAERLFDLVGLLHLERLVMTPVGVQRGELLYSLPLAPRETVTLSHKEWTIRDEEYSRYIQDYLENYSETGAAQTTELARSTETQARRLDATSANLTSISGQPVSVTTPVPATAGAMVDAASSLQESLAEIRTVTTKATARTIRDHRVSFTVATVRGTEDWTSRLLRNRNDGKSMMIDYYRRMRRWRNELYRYGVRLTYDVVVPHPGRRVLNRYNRLRQLETELARGFQPKLGPSSIGVHNWKGLANVYKVPLPPPPPDLKIEEAWTINYPQPGDHTAELQLLVPPGYRLFELGYQVNAGTWQTGERGAVVFIGPYTHNALSTTVTGINMGPTQISLVSIPERGPVKMVVFLRQAGGGKIRLFAKVVPTTEAIEAWKHQCWGILREGELAVYHAKLDEVRAERLHLQRAVDAADTLSLRRIEREHIMLACLEWLFPFLELDVGWFDNVPDTPTDFDRVMGLQASLLIKLMHTAIDWDAMLVTLLPFFWERIDNLATDFVDHADPLHREFLRAGAARVVLPIRPGHEDEILSLFDFALVGPLPVTHRYKAIVDEVAAAHKKYTAKTHPATATAPDGSLNPTYEGDYPLEDGTLIGRWHETMPTGALDMEVTLKAVTEV